MGKRIRGERRALAIAIRAEELDAYVECPTCGKVTCYTANCGDCGSMLPPGLEQILPGADHQERPGEMVEGDGLEDVVIEETADSDPPIDLDQAFLDGAFEDLRNKEPDEDGDDAPVERPTVVEVESKPAVTPAPVKESALAVNQRLAERMSEYLESKRAARAGGIVTVQVTDRKPAVEEPDERVVTDEEAARIIADRESMFESNGALRGNGHCSDVPDSLEAYRDAGRGLLRTDVSGAQPVVEPAVQSVEERPVNKPVAVEPVVESVVQPVEVQPVVQPVEVQPVVEPETAGKPDDVYVVDDVDEAVASQPVVQPEEVAKDEDVPLWVVVAACLVTGFAWGYLVCYFVN